MSSTLIHYHVDDSSFLLLHVCKLSLQQRETWFPPSAIHSCNCSIPIFIDSGIRIFNSCPWEKQFYLLECSAYVQFLLPFSLTDYSDFQSDCGQYFLLPLSFSEIVSHICNIVRFFCHILHSILGSSISQTIFKHLYTLKFPLCAIKLYGF